jgi:hypothetical protein
LYAVRLNQLAVDFADRDVEFIGVNSNPQDSLEEIAVYLPRTLAYLSRSSRTMTATARTTFKATRTPEVIALDARGQVIYRGRIDDQYRPGVTQSQPQREDLKEAIQEFLADKKVTIED